MRLLFLFCLSIVTASTATEPPMASLKAVSAPYFHMGVAMERGHLNDPASGPHLRQTLVLQQFDSITPENSMKWASVQPEEGTFTFASADALADFAMEHGYWLVGHTLVWDHQTPEWVFRDATREVLLKRMREHIHAVIGHFKGRVKAWDVVNEAIENNGVVRVHGPWHRIIGPDYIEQAFRFAHEADPDAELYYNDYCIEFPEKREATVRLVKQLKAAGLRIDGVGIQAHFDLDVNLTDVENAIVALHEAGVQVMFTELDISALPSAYAHRGADISKLAAYRAEIDPYTNGLPAEVARKQAEVYGKLFALFRKHHDKISRVTFWGIDDSCSWLNQWPVRGRTDYPLLFDRQGKPKPAFHAVVETLSPKE